MKFRFCAKIWPVYLFIVPILAAQFAYFEEAIREKPELPGNVDMVLVFSVDDIRVPAGITLARRCGTPYFMVSDKGLNDFRAEIKKFGLPGKAQIILEGRAGTTDQNARFTASIIRRLPVKRVCLVTSWFHIPRALFLTRLYNLNHSVEIFPFPADKPPIRWWISRDFIWEYLKFWGSLIRVCLALIGIEDWPLHFNR